MGRDGWIYRKILRTSLFVILCLLNLHCTKYSNLEDIQRPECNVAENETAVTIVFDGCCAETRGTGHRISDLSLIVFDEQGYAERNIEIKDGDTDVVLNLIEGRTYSFFACMNFGYHVFADHIGEMSELTYHTNSLDISVSDMPACGSLRNVIIQESQEISIIMERLYAGISIAMDRSKLHEDVDMKVTGLRLCNSPKHTNVFSRNENISSRECFDNGWYWNAGKVDALNIAGSDGLSGAVDIYLLENIENDTIDESSQDLVYTYLEIEMDYLSYTHYNCEGPLIYRTYLGEMEINHNIVRNTHRNIIIRPEGSGLNKQDWRVDTTCIRKFGPSKFASFPDSYQKGEIGDTLHLWCEFYPPHAAFDVGLEELEHDKKEGIYDYLIDEDGHGVRLILKNPGVGIIYMQAGSPVNESAMWVVVVNQPPDERISSGRESNYI